MPADEDTDDPGDGASGPASADRTPEEQAVLDELAEQRGEAFAEEYAELALAQARLVGRL